MVYTYYIGRVRLIVAMLKQVVMYLDKPEYTETNRTRINGLIQLLGKQEPAEDLIGLQTIRIDRYEIITLKVMLKTVLDNLDDKEEKGWFVYRANTEIKKLEKYLND